MSSNHSIGSMNQLADALDAIGFTPEDVTKLRQFKNLAGIKALLYGQAELKMIDHIIDLDAKPFVPEGWEIRPEDQIARAEGKWKFDPTKVIFHLSKNQQGDKYIEGNKLKKELAKMSNLPASVLDYLLAHKELIPDSWKKDENGNTRYIFFWGTIYRYSFGGPCVRCLCFGDGEWDQGYCWLDRYFGSDYPSAVVAS